MRQALPADVCVVTWRPPAGRAHAECHLFKRGGMLSAVFFFVFFHFLFFYYWKPVITSPDCLNVPLSRKMFTRDLKRL